MSNNSNANTIAGNCIGVDSAASARIPNLFSGVCITAAHSNSIGGLEPAARNIVSGNTYYGIQITGGSSANVIRGNHIGPDLSGSRPLPNGRSGIRIESPANLVDGKNVISGNALDGLVLTGASASNNVVQGNRIGLAGDGVARLPNGRAGLGLSAAGRNLIGGTSASGEIGGASFTPGVRLRRSSGVNGSPCTPSHQ